MGTPNEANVTLQRDLILFVSMSINILWPSFTDEICTESTLESTSTTQLFLITAKEKSSCR